MKNLKNNKQPNLYQAELKKTQDDLVVAYLPAVRAMAFKLKERLPSSVDVNDLISIAVEELIKLSRKYDQSKNSSFWGYAKQRAHGAMLDYLRSLDVMSRSNRKLSKIIDRETTKYFNEHGEEPSDEYLAEVLNEDIEKIQSAQNTILITSVLPINEQISFFSENKTEDIIEQEDLIEHILAILKDFTDQEQLIVQLYYFEELNLREISDIMKISESRICQIHKKLLIKLRERLSK